MTTAADELPRDACTDAREWASQFSTLDHAWAACDRPDWMAWLAGRWSSEPGSDGRRRLVLCLSEIARTVLHLVPAGEDRPRRAVETAEAWARGDAGITLEDVRIASAAAARAAAGAYAADAAAVSAAAAEASNGVSAYATATVDEAAAYAADAGDIVTIIRRYYPAAPRPSA